MIIGSRDERLLETLCFVLHGYKRYSIALYRTQHRCESPSRGFNSLLLSATTLDDSQTIHIKICSFNFYSRFLWVGRQGQLHRAYSIVFRSSDSPVACPRSNGYHWFVINIPYTIIIDPVLWVDTMTKWCVGSFSVSSGKTSLLWQSVPGDLNGLKLFKSWQNIRCLFETNMH